MTVTMDQLQRGVVSYYEAEIAQRASGVGQFAAYFIMPSIPGMVAQKVEQFRNLPIASGLITADGLVDIDAVRDRAAEAMKHCGSIELYGFRLNADDVTKLYDHIRRA